MSAYLCMLLVHKTGFTGIDQQKFPSVQGCDLFIYTLLVNGNSSILMIMTGFNPNQPGLFWRLSSPGGGGGGGAAPAPPSDLGRGSRNRRENVNYKTVLLDYSLLLSFVLYELIMLIYATKKILFSL